MSSIRSLCDAHRVEAYGYRLSIGMNIPTVLKEKKVEIYRKTYFR